jgi:hypothetical protein
MRVWYPTRPLEACPKYIYIYIAVAQVNVLRWRTCTHGRTSTTHGSVPASSLSSTSERKPTRFIWLGLCLHLVGFMFAFGWVHVCIWLGSCLHLVGFMFAFGCVLLAFRFAHVATDLTATVLARF